MACATYETLLSFIPATDILELSAMYTWYVSAVFMCQSMATRQWRLWLGALTAKVVVGLCLAEAEYREHPGGLADMLHISWAI
jgi:hypothetical protein